MKLGSKYFDSIRVKPEENRLKEDRFPSCNWRGCDRSGRHKAPRGRGHEGEYLYFCVDHVRQYNKQYNYFSGMSDEEVVDYQKSSSTGHRPTWEMGKNAQSGSKTTARERVRGKGFSFAGRAADPHKIFDDEDAGGGRRSTRKNTRPIRNMERKSLTALNLDINASKAEISARFKELVKRHHPDINGGDKGSEDKLREVIQAYNYLRNAGLV